jgi:hypothetical protein
LKAAAVGVTAFYCAQLRLLFHASANEAAAFQEMQMLLLCFKSTVLFLLCEKLARGSDLARRFPGRGSRLRAYRTAKRKRKNDSGGCNAEHEGDLSVRARFAALN